MAPPSPLKLRALTMAAIPLALSIHHFISSVGADAGFAAIIGLALLVLLFFAQARETANLRRRADEAESELQALQLYVQQLARTPAPAPAPAPQPSVVPVAAPPAAARIGARPAAAARGGPCGRPEPAGAVATIPAAPAGVGAPALSAATRLIPVGDEISIRALRPSIQRPRRAGGATAPPPPPLRPGRRRRRPPAATDSRRSARPPPPSAGLTAAAPPPPAGRPAPAGRAGEPPVV